MKLIILGPPGSGKGTQAELISKDFKLKHIIASDLIKNEIKNKTKEGKLMNLYLSQGKLVPDELIIPIFKKNIPKNNYILDGFPRTLKQAEFLNEISKADKIIFLDVPKKVIKERLVKRAKIENRIDDNLKIINIRLEVYEKDTKPLLDYYKNNLILIQGNKTVNEIEKDIIKKLIV